MGWSRGAELLDEVWSEVVEYVPKKQHEEVAKRIVNIFLEYDADTISSETRYKLLRKAAQEILGWSSDEEQEEDEY